MNARDFARASKDAITDRLALHDAYRSVFDGPKGRIVLRHLCKQANVLTSSFVAGDPHQTAFNEGERRIVLSILRFINRNPDELIRQLEEEYEKAP